jgi:hypothetical protein
MQDFRVIVTMRWNWQMADIYGKSANVAIMATAAGSTLGKLE